MVDHELDALKREFLAEADEKVRAMQAALQDGGTRESLDRLAYLAHQLKGSGGSYGYPSISSDAAEIEKAAERVAAGQASFDDEHRAIQQRVANLGSTIEKSSRELSPARV
jgi:HPt (histidine-containing phosphotransfer) domain-containing protein